MSIDIIHDKLKIVDIVPVFKRENQDDNTHYRTISLLPLISNIFEKIHYQ